MSSTTHDGLSYARFTRRATAGPSAVIATPAMAEEAGRRLEEESRWVQMLEVASAMPPLNFTTNPLLDAYDAFKLATDYSAGKQSVAVGSVAYRFRLPADALTSGSGSVPTKVVSAAIRVYVDRWLIGGVRVAALVSDDEEPPSDWTDAREGDVYDDAFLPATTPRSDQTAVCTLTFPTDGAAVDAGAYLYIMLSLEDVDSVSPLDVRRLEGGALLAGATMSVTFADTTASDDATELTMADGFGRSFDTSEGYEGNHAWITYSTGIAGGENPLLWQRGFEGLFREGTVANSDAGWRRADLKVGCAFVDVDDDVQVYGVALARFLYLTEPQQISGLRFTGGIPTLESGFEHRLAIYLARSWPTSEMQLMTTPKSAQLGDLVMGLERTARFAAKDVDVAASTGDLELLYTAPVTGPLVAATVYPVSFAASGAVAVIASLAPTGVVGDGPTAADAGGNVVETVTWVPGEIVLQVR